MCDNPISDDCRLTWLEGLTGMRISNTRVIIGDNKAAMQL